MAKKKAVKVPEAVVGDIPEPDTLRQARRLEAMAKAVVQGLVTEEEPKAVALVLEKLIVDSRVLYATLRG